MDITKYEDCVGDKKNASVEKKIEHGVQEITPSFSSKLPAITSERTIEAERVRFNNIAMPMDISIHIDDSFNCAGLLKITACSNSLNNSSVPESNNDEDLFKHEQSKNNSLAKKTYNPKIVPLKHATLKYDYRCLNVTSFTNVGLNVDFNSSQCNLSSSMSYNSPLFPPVKCKKLNLRQLNAEIGDGKIVVFPNKNVDNVEVGACLVSNKNVGFKPNNNEIREEKNISNLGKSQINNSSAELKPSEISEFDVSKHENSFMLADSASFFVKAKVLDSIMKINDKYRRDTIHFNSEMHTFSPTVTHVNPTIIESEVECVTKNVNNITLFNSSLTSNHSSMQTDDLSPIELTPCQQNVDKCDSVGRTIYEIVDMSLNNTDKEISAIISPKRIEPEIFVINDNSSYGRKTIYFDQEIDSLSATKIEYSHNTQEKVENMIHELKFTLHRKPMIVSKKILRRQIGAEIFNSSSDSFIVNLQEAKAALSSHRKPIIEGTPHRSFLEFEDLEREFEQDQLVCETNAKASVQQHPKLKLFDACRNEIRCNEANHSLIQNEIIRGKSQNQFKEKENEPDEKRFENIESHQNNETGNLDESGLKPIISAVIENTLLLSPIFNSVTNKRPTANLTPSLPSPKKRHTLLFNDCGTDESKILSANMTLRIRSCNEDAEVRNILGESKCRDALLEDRKFSPVSVFECPSEFRLSSIIFLKEQHFIPQVLHTYM
ncbi:uncharacterized protein LOC118754248 [Rhagoletis pomonella]|uniref:uncharacterized protein LOC118754248 n=1 Tax=Rhagoletis pomonella TaxID=28610 RepID=UPI00177AC6B7|nr:uncharacterized protein LOC118754248 [Rhagoletis pomonella]